MSEPIIIEIPSPTCRARFVLVHVGQCSGTTCGIPRDATPADLERAGWVKREVPSAEAWKAAHAEAERELIRARAALAEQPDPGTLAHLRADLRDAVKRAEHAERELRDMSERAGDAERERDEAKELARVLEVERDAALDARNACAAERNEARAEVERVSHSASGTPLVEQRAAGIRAVAAHVRKECLVAQAVGMMPGVRSLTIWHEGPGANTVGVRVNDIKAIMQAPTDVPATLARLLGEVSR